MRQRGKQTLEETDSALDKFGQDFQDTQCLLISEVRVLLQVAKDKKRGEKSVAEIIQKTIDYCDKFSKFTNKATVKEVRLILKDDFSQFESAQLANLGCETVEEAKTLIPRYFLSHLA